MCKFGISRSKSFIFLIKRAFKMSKMVFDLYKKNQFFVEFLFIFTFNKIQIEFFPWRRVQKVGEQTHFFAYLGKYSALGIRSFQKNVSIFALFSVLYKRTEQSLRSFTFFIKERNRTLCSFWFHWTYKNCKFRKKRM